MRLRISGLVPFESDTKLKKSSPNVINYSLLSYFVKIVSVSSVYNSYNFNRVICNIIFITKIHKDYN